MTVARTMRSRQCRCGRWYDMPEPWPNPWPRAYCSPDCHRARERSPAASPRKPVAAASLAQRVKTLGSTSIVSGETRRLDSAHLCSRALGGCDDALCTVALTRAEHRAFDDGRLDLLPYLVAAGAVDELAHALAHYHGDLIGLLERVSGCVVTLTPRRPAS